MSKSDLLHIIEAAYDVDASDAIWLRQVAEAVRPHIDTGFGVAAFEFSRSSGELPQIVQRYHLGIPPALEALYPQVFATMDPEIRQRPFSLGPCVTGSQLMGMRDEFRRQPHMMKHVHQFGMFDSLWVTATDPAGRGIGLHAGRAKIGWATPTEVRRWGRIAGHLSAAVRLRHRLKIAEANGESPAAEAVLDTRGNVQDAHGEATRAQALEMLGRSVRMLEKVRGPARRKEEDASLGDWRALVGGRWSLVDRIESDGRRYVLARENEPSAPGPPKLTAREKQVIGYARLGHHNKLIAYELGIADSTVRVLLGRAAAKLGVRTREALLELFAPGGQALERQ
jgi:DNA-binding CsgD family transcriptional regulator